MEEPNLATETRPGSPAGSTRRRLSRAVRRPSPANWSSGVERVSMTPMTTGFALVPGVVSTEDPFGHDRGLVAKCNQK